MRNFESGSKDLQIRFEAVPMRRGIHPLDAVSAIQLMRFARRLGPFDLIHGHSSKAGALARLVGYWLGIPTVYTPHAIITLDPLLPAFKRMFYGRIERLLASLGPGRMIAVCRDELEHAARLGIAQRSDPSRAEWTGAAGIALT